mmetsp:Transcript_32440/g.79389  ORF Transcript_32440/g.79389 Transcript_32440/m.79389 type:complete len:244 (+) Transcript_32440:144-875(+)
MVGSASSSSAMGQASEYLRRAVHYGQMDLEMTFWQMLYLCVAPSVVYRNTKYHRQTKNQWARDDPGFTTVLMYFLVSACIAFCLAFQKSWVGFVSSVTYTVFVDFVLVGISVATLTWYFANTFLRVIDQDAHATEQKVEWLYAFDIHCNSFFPLFMVLYVLQYFLVMIVLRPGFLPTLVSNTLYVTALSAYCYITFLGYEALPFIQGATIFLYPIPLLGLMYIISLGLGLNVSRLVLGAYFGS